MVGLLDRLFTPFPHHTPLPPPNIGVSREHLLYDSFIIKKKLIMHAAYALCSLLTGQIILT